MDDSEDYFGDDDFVLDEQTLAALDESERRAQQQTQAPAPQAPLRAPPQYSHPVAKRARTETGWSPGLGARQDSLTDFDLPEISVQGNSYTISSSTIGLTDSRAQQLLAPTRQATYQACQTTPAAKSNPYQQEQYHNIRGNPPRPHLVQPRLPAPSSSQLPQAVSARPNAPQKLVNRLTNYQQPRQLDNRQRIVTLAQVPNNFARGNTVSSAGPNVQRDTTPTRQPQQQSPYNREYPTPPMSNNRNGTHSHPTGVPSPAHPAPLQAQGSDRLLEQLRQLQAHVQELESSTAKLKAERDSAMEMKMRKDGEVAILRQNREKDRERYAAEIAKYKADKEEALALALQQKRSHKDEVEKLKTHFTFKQQELEANFRKIPTMPVPPSVRAKKTATGFPPTPLARASSLNWNMEIHQTPSKPPQSFTYNMQKVPSPRKYAAKSPERMKLPGFQNAFATSTPVLGNQKRAKGKGKSNDFPEPLPPPRFGQPPPPTIPHDSQSFTMAPPDSFHLPSPPKSGPLQLRPKDQEVPPLLTDTDGDFTMEDDIPASVVAPSSSTPAVTREGTMTPDMVVEQLDEIKPTNWKTELSRIVLTHIRPNSGHLTLELLLSADIDDDDKVVPRRYMQACSAIMNALSHSPKMDDYANTVGTICSACITLLEILSYHDLIVPMASLLNLLGLLSFFIPQFRTQLFQQENPSYPGVALILVETSRIVITILGGPNSGPTHDMLGMEILDFLEAVSFEADEAEMVKFEAVVRSKEAMMVLLDPSRPTEFLEKSLRLLVIYATHPVLYSALIGAPNPQGKILGSMVPNELLHRLQPFLTYHLYSGPEFLEVRHLVLTFLGQLSQTHPEAHLVVAASCILQLSWYVHSITMPLWEEDPKLVSSLECASSLVEHTCQCVYLISHLVMPYPPERLRKWLQAPSDNFRNAMEMFVVTFSRLGYAVSPDWLDEASRKMLDQSKGIAQKVLETVIDGPELDSVVEAYTQNDPEDESSMIDEDEMEAELS